jgi:hypothetical protein
VHLYRFCGLLFWLISLFLLVFCGERVKSLCGAQPPHKVQLNFSRPWPCLPLSGILSGFFSVAAGIVPVGLDRFNGKLQRSALFDSIFCHRYSFFTLPFGALSLVLLFWAHV